MDINNILSRLEMVKSNGTNKYMARCPAHDDKSPSLSVAEKDGRILIHCFAGCGAHDVLDTIGVNFKELFQDDIGYSKPIFNPLSSDRFFVAIYKSDIRKGIKPTAEETQRYRDLFKV